MPEPHPATMPADAPTSDWTYPQVACPHCDQHPHDNCLDEHLADAHADLPPCAATLHDTHYTHVLTCALRAGHTSVYPRTEYWHATTHDLLLGRTVWNDTADGATPHREAATEATEPDGPTVCDAYQPPSAHEDCGTCARCGMYDYKHTAAAAATETAEPHQATAGLPQLLARITDGATAGAELADHYRRLGIELQHWQISIVPDLHTRAEAAEQRAETASRDADIYQGRLERLGQGYTRERKRAEKAEGRADELREALIEVLATFSTTARDVPGGTILGHIAEAPIHPDDMARWRAALDPTE